MYITSQQSYLRKFTRGKQVLRHILIASVNHVTVVRHNPSQLFIKTIIFYCMERHFKKLFTVIITGELMNSMAWHLYRKCFVVSLDIDDFLHLLRMHRNANRNFFNDRKNVSATTSHTFYIHFIHTCSFN